MDGTDIRLSHPSSEEGRSGASLPLPGPRWLASLTDIPALSQNPLKVLGLANLAGI